MDNKAEQPNSAPDYEQKVELIRRRLKEVRDFQEVQLQKGFYKDID